VLRQSAIGVKNSFSVTQAGNIETEMLHLLAFYFLLQSSVVSIAPGKTRDEVRQSLMRIVPSFDSVEVKGRLVSYHARAIRVNGTLYDDAQIFFERDTAALIYLDTRIDNCKAQVDSLPVKLGKGELLHFIHGPIKDIALVRFVGQDVAFLFQCAEGRLRTEMARTHRHPRFGDL
jgi:hypothetical protein